jgi:dTDP-4-dehydrorhamnose 3,5-epimerase
MEIAATALPEVLILTPRRFGDTRGWFSEVYNRRVLAEHGIGIDFVQDNHSYSAPVGTLRGLHFQTPPHVQAKLVRVVRGRVLDIAVDIRHGSPTFGRHVMVELSADDGRMILVPHGFAHAFLTLEPDCEFVYKVDNYYAPGHAKGVAFDDPDLAIPWPIPAERLTLSEADRNQPRLRDLPEYFPYPRS